MSVCIELICFFLEMIVEFIIVYVYVVCLVHLMQNSRQIKKKIQKRTIRQVHSNIQTYKICENSQNIPPKNSAFVFSCCLIISPTNRCNRHLKLQHPSVLCDLPHKILYCMDDTAYYEIEPPLTMVDTSNEMLL